MCLNRPDFAPPPIAETKRRWDKKEIYDEYDGIWPGHISEQRDRCRCNNCGEILALNAVVAFNCKDDKVFEPKNAQCPGEECRDYDCEEPMFEWCCAMCHFCERDFYCGPEEPPFASVNCRGCGELYKDICEAEEIEEEGNHDDDCGMTPYEGHREEFREFECWVKGEKFVAEEPGLGKLAFHSSRTNPEIWDTILDFIIPLEIVRTPEDDNNDVMEVEGSDNNPVSASDFDDMPS